MSVGVLALVTLLECVVGSCLLVVTNAISVAVLLYFMMGAVAWVFDASVTARRKRSRRSQ